MASRSGARGCGSGAGHLGSLLGHAGHPLPGQDGVRGAAQGHELRAVRDRRRCRRQRANGGVRQVTHQGVRSVVDVEGAVSFPKEPHVSTTHQVEIQVRKNYCINRAIPTLPFNLEDAARSEAEFEK
ncbi:hypothetical protein PVAP13_3KG460901 [Panicum virgatum]|nr:hypothetical protein PVAP13_3KG460901 [Panicum virgatum]